MGYYTTLTTSKYFSTILLRYREREKQQTGREMGISENNRGKSANKISKTRTNIITAEPNRKMGGHGTSET